MNQLSFIDKKNKQTLSPFNNVIENERQMKHLRYQNIYICCTSTLTYFDYSGSLKHRASSASLHIMADSQKQQQQLKRMTTTNQFIVPESIIKTGIERVQGGKCIISSLFTHPM